MSRRDKKEDPDVPVRSADSPASDANPDGRDLRLKFKSKSPALDRVEFRFSSDWTPLYFQRGDERYLLNWPDVESAFSLYFLGCVVWRKGNEFAPFLFGADSGDAPLAKQLGGAKYQAGHKSHELFFGENPKNATNDPIVTHLVFPAIQGVSKSGRSKTKPLNIPVSERFLPADCVQVFWDCRGGDQLRDVSNYIMCNHLREGLKTISVEDLKGSARNHRLFKLLTEILNEGLRPHLKVWQSRFRKWHEDGVLAGRNKGITNQEFQKGFPQFGDLREHLAKTSARLLKFRDRLEKALFQGIV